MSEREPVAVPQRPRGRMRPRDDSRPAPVPRPQLRLLPPVTPAFQAEQREGFEARSSSAELEAAREALNTVGFEVIERLGETDDIRAELGIRFGAALIDLFRASPVERRYEEYDKAVKRIMDIAAQREVALMYRRRGIEQSQVSASQRADDVQYALVHSIRPRLAEFTNCTIGPKAEFAIAQALTDIGEIDGASLAVKFPAGKGADSDNVHLEEGQGIDWVVDIDRTHLSADGAVHEQPLRLLVQVKAVPILPKDLPFVAQICQTPEQLEWILRVLEPQLIEGGLRDDDVAARFKRIRNNIAETMAKAMQAAEKQGGCLPILVLLPSIGGQERRNEAYYDTRTAAPTPALRDKLRDAVRPLLTAHY